jgi:putative ABC transport system substrate-binding protein
VRRRDFITLLGGATAWPLAVRAQQQGKVARIGVLMPWAADDPMATAGVAAFQQELRQRGWTDGRDISIDIRRVAGNADETRKQAAELVALAPDAILASTSPTMVALRQVTRTVPIVFVQVLDPVGAGFVASLGLAATPAVLRCLSSASAENGWSCSRRSRLG